MKNRNGKIFVFGDSHALFWDGTELPNTEKLYSDIDVHHLGPILAWNAREKCLGEIKALTTMAGTPDYIFLSFGEIDVRTGRSRQEECALRLFDVAKTLAKDIDTEVVIVTPPPPSDEGENDPSYHRVGELARREFRTARFVAAVDSYVSSPLKNGAVISTIHPSIILRDVEGVYSDGRHLNRKALNILMDCEEKKFRRYFVNRVS